MSECNACFYAGDYDGPDSGCYFASEVRARKKHFCCECGDPIAIGSVHELVKGKWDGRFYSFRTCQTCVEIRDAFACEGFVHATLWENIRDGMLENMTTGCLEKLTTASAKQKLLDEWNDWKFER